jgi:hypothetical protein
MVNARIDLKARGLKTMEYLGKDKDGRMSSLPPLKSGENRGRRGKERGGEWLHVASCCYDHANDSNEQIAHAKWVEAVLSLGHRVGHHDYDGVRSYYVLKTNESETRG